MGSIYDGSSSGGGGSSGGSIYGGGGGTPLWPVNSPSGGGGSFLDSIIGKVYGGGMANPINWVHHAAADVGPMLEGIPLAIANTGQATYKDLRLFTNPAELRYQSEHNPGRVPSHLVNDVGVPIAKSYEQTYGPLVHGNFDQFIRQLYAHPLGPALDVATLFSGGAAGLAKVGRAAEFGARFPETASAFEKAARSLPASERLARYARNVDMPRYGYLESEDPVFHAERGMQLYERTGKGVYDFAPVDAARADEIAGAGGRLYQRFTTRKSMTPYGRAFDRMIDRIGLNKPELARIGNVSRSGRAHDRVLRMTRAEWQSRRRTYDNAWRTLNKDEMTAFHLAFENGPRDFSGVPAAIADAWTVYHDTKQGYSRDPLTGERVRVDVPQESHALRSYMEVLLRKPWKEIEPEMNRLLREHAGNVTAAARELADGTPVDRVLRNSPSPEFQHALDLAHDLQARGAKVYTDLNILTPELVRARQWLGARVRSGARYTPERLVPITAHDPLAGMRQELAVQLRRVTAEHRRASDRLDQANQAAERASLDRAAAKPAPELEQLVAKHSAAEQALREAQAELRSATERAVGHTPEYARAGRQRVHGDTARKKLAASYEAAATGLRRIRGDLVRAEKDFAAIKKAAVRSVDRLAAAQHRYITAPGGGRKRDAAYSAYQHAQNEHERLGIATTDARAKVTELRRQRDSAELAADSARRARDQFAERDRKLLAAQRVERKLRQPARVARGELERATRRHDHAVRLHEEAQKKAADIAEHQQALHATMEDTQAQMVKAQEETAYVGHGTPQGSIDRGPALSTAEREAIIKREGFGGQSTATLQALPRARLEQALRQAPGIMGAAPSVRLIDGTIERLNNATIGASGDLLLMNGNLVDAGLVNAVLDHAGNVIDEMGPAAKAPGLPVEKLGVKPGEERIAHVQEGFIGGYTQAELAHMRDAELDGTSDLWDVHPAYGNPDRFPHIGAEDPLERVVQSVQNSGVRPPKLPGNTKRNRAVRLLSARFIAHPVVISRDYVRTMGYAMVLDMRKWLEGRSGKLTDSGDGLGNESARNRQWTYYFNGDARPPRQIKEVEGLQRDRALLSGQPRPTDISDAARISVWDGKGNVEDWLSRVYGPADAERRDLRWMHENGIRRVRVKDANRLLKEARAGDNVGWRMYDRYMDVWRALVLPYRPAWLVYNIVGQHLLYAMNYGGIAGARAYLDGIRTEKVKHPATGEDVNWIKIRRLAIAKRQRKFAAEVEQVAPGNFFSSIAETHQDVNRIWAGDNAVGRRIDAIHATEWGLAWKQGKLTAAGKLSTAALNAGSAAVLGFRDGISYLNFKIADDFPRTAAFKREATRDRAIMEIRRTAKELEGANLSIGEALKRADKETIMRLMDNVDRALGNFLDMGSFERVWVRRFIPFYSWFKVITRLTARLFVDHPGRMNLMRNLVIAAGSNPELSPDGEMPSYLKGAIALPIPAPFGQQDVLVTTGINPFETVNQLAAGLGGLAHGQITDPQTGEAQTTMVGSGSPYGFLGPAASSFIAGFGIDPFYGSNYQGLGAGQGAVPQALGYQVSSLPQSRLAAQITGAQKSSLYDSNARLAGVRYPWWAYMGLPIRRVNLSEAHSRAQAGQ